MVDEENITFTNDAARKFHEKWKGFKYIRTMDGKWASSWAHGFGNYEYYRNYYENNDHVISFKVSKHDDTGFVYDRSIIGKKKSPVYFGYNGNLYCETWLTEVHEILGSIVVLEEWEIIGLVPKDVDWEDVDDLDLKEFDSTWEPDNKEPELVEETMHVFIAKNAKGDCLAIASYEKPPKSWSNDNFINEVKKEMEPSFNIEDIMDSTVDPFGDF